MILEILTFYLNDTQMINIGNDIECYRIDTQNIDIDTSNTDFNRTNTQNICININTCNINFYQNNAQRLRIPPSYWTVQWKRFVSLERSRRPSAEMLNLIWVNGPSGSSEWEENWEGEEEEAAGRLRDEDGVMARRGRRGGGVIIIRARTPTWDLEGDGDEGGDTRLLRSLALTCCNNREIQLLATQWADGGAAEHQAQISGGGGAHGQSGPPQSGSNPENHNALRGNRRSDLTEEQTPTRRFGKRPRLRRLKDLSGAPACSSNAERGSDKTKTVWGSLGGSAAAARIPAVFVTETMEANRQQNFWWCRSRGGGWTTPVNSLPEGKLKR